ncbi:MAG: hypothetical protein ACRCTY_08165 [Candidatus Adiutrix sp.]
MENKKLIYVLSKICENSSPGKKTVQKLIYLMKRKGLDLGFDYIIHYYGPYSADLDDELHVMALNNIIAIKKEKMSHHIKMSKRKRINPLKPLENDILDSVFTAFLGKSPHQLEIITTTDFVAHVILNNDNLSAKTIEDEVKKIKGKKFTTDEIQSSIKILCDHALLKL